MSSTLPAKPSILRSNSPSQHAAVKSPQRHPRRPLASASVTLRHAALEPHRKQIPVQPTSKIRTSPSDRSSLINHKSSSGESSNAERWFETSNNNVGENAAEFVDNDPPFYHRDSSNESPSNIHPQESDNSGQFVSYRPKSSGQVPVFSPGSSTEEYRSVIDDLTIENQKLKQKLKQLSKSNDSPIDADRLFEVRVHGLPAAKKRELDEILQHFALGLEVSPTAGSGGAVVDSMVPQLPGKSSFSHLSKFGDSGYGSAATSGRTPTAESGSSSASQHKKATPAQDASSRNQTIRSYLHDIPVGLLPRHAKAMSEKARKKLVIRRLEQIFAGRGAANEGHQLPIQQQEVSHSAARDDRSAIEARGQRAKKEGIREAPIMDMENENNLEMAKDDSKNDSLNAATDEQNSALQSAEQRPTRPLDLDPHRAQIPAENMQYFRHLGFEVGDAAETTNADNWIYLNLLINMAQLHTINVTSDFVKQAVAEYSTKLELSSDGRKVRWRGGQRLTHDSSPSSAALSNENSMDSNEEEATMSRKRMKLSHGGSTKSGQSHAYRNTSNSQAASQAESKLNYTPLFRHKQYVDNSENDSASGNESDSSSVPDDEANEDMYSAHDLALHKRKDDGLMVFYNKAKFCTDLSGNPRGLPRSAENDTDYMIYTAAAVGSTARPSNTRRMFSSTKESPLYTTKVAAGTVDSTESEADLSLDGLSASSISSKRVQFAESTEMDFEVSGLGGVRPADNLAITVLRQKERADSPATTLKSPAMSSRLAHVLARKGSAATQGTVERIVSSHSRKLPPSELPLPSYVMTGDDSDSDVDSDDSNSLYAYNGSRPTLSTAPQPLALISPNTSIASSDDEDESDFFGEEEDEDDSGSVDLLAAARAIDPATVRAREREYDANMAERLAEEIPAGSSAATAGGGSGYTSPASAAAVVMDEMDVSDEGVGDDVSVSS